MIQARIKQLEKDLAEKAEGKGQAEEPKSRKERRAAAAAGGKPAGKAAQVEKRAGSGMSLGADDEVCASEWGHWLLLWRLVHACGLMGACCRRTMRRRRAG